MRISIFIIIGIVVIVAGIYWYGDRHSTGSMNKAVTTTMKTVSYTAQYGDTDRVEIIGNYWRGSGTKAVILLHMMPATKESWNTFAEKLNKQGYHILAIDLRGHGKSTKGKTNGGSSITLNYQTFSDKEHQDSIHDVEGARQWLLTNQGIAYKNIFIGGASIGANLALGYMAAHPETKRGFLLSPGLDFRGITTETLMGQLAEQQSVYLAAAENDTYSADSVRALSVLGNAEKTAKLFPGIGKRTHGTDLFVAYPDFMDTLIAWLEKETAP